MNYYKIKQKTIILNLLINILLNQLINILNNHSDDADTIIYDLLNNITDNGNDDLVINHIKSWLDEIN